MSSIQTAVIAFALAADCFAVSVSGGTRTKTPALTAVKFALYFGIAQAAMLTAGWLAGAWFRPLFFGIANIAAFAFLAVAGVRMIFEAFKNGRRRSLDLENPGMILSLAFATSIDALVVGAGLSLLYYSISPIALTVGAVAFLASFAGVFAGEKSGTKLKQKAEIGGGLILILIGIRILFNRLL